jgi:hypothetical protein
MSKVKHLGFCCCLQHIVEVGIIEDSRRHGGGGLSYLFRGVPRSFESGNRTFRVCPKRPSWGPTGDGHN